jgi:putative transposase
MERDLSASGCIYVWAGGIRLRIRLEGAKAAVLVMRAVKSTMQIP